MKAATINELKQELLNASSARLTELCLRLARFKKENKELLTYLLFEAHDTDAYITSVKEEMALQFDAIKTLRKILRIANKFIRYSASAIVETELLIFFCLKLKAMGDSINKNPVILNIFQNQLKKINKSISAMHEDLQYDYQREVRALTV